MANVLMTKVREYIFVDKLGHLLPQRLLLKRLLSDATWGDFQDSDGGVTSLLGFRIIGEVDRQARIVNAETGHRYLRYDEVEETARARRQAEDRRRELEAELTRLQRQHKPE